jgi:hypothetical protein
MLTEEVRFDTQEHSFDMIFEHLLCAPPITQ